MKRRKLLASAAAAGTAAVGLAATPDMSSGRRTARAGGDVAADGSPIVAYVSDPARGEVVVMVGDKEVVRTDRGLAADLSAIAREANDVIAS